MVDKTEKSLVDRGEARDACKHSNVKEFPKQVTGCMVLRYYINSTILGNLDLVGIYRMSAHWSQGSALLGTSGAIPRTY